MLISLLLHHMVRRRACVLYGHMASGAESMQG
jgi:hypothetical protein